MSLESGGSSPQDPLAMRALAHPHRLALREALIRRGPLTAAEAARELGISQALASHHMRQLAKYGFLEEAEARDQRERRWRVVDRSLAWGGPGQDSEHTATTEVLEQLYLERALARYTRWQDERGALPAPWRDQGGLSDNLLEMTVEETAEFNRAVAALLAPFVERASRPHDRPEDTRPVAVTVLVTPTA